MQTRRSNATVCALIVATALLAPRQASAQDEGKAQGPRPEGPMPFTTVNVEIAGYWTDLFHEDLWDRRSGLLVGDFTGLPLNDAGKLAAASWDPGWFAIPEEQCRPHTGIYALRGPTGLQISKVVDPSTYQLVAYHVLLGLSERTIFMDGRPHPPDYASHTFSGFSTGRWEGNMLVIKTTHVKAGYLQRNGPPHSDQVLTTEYFLRQGDTLMLITIIEDPGYLSEPLIRTTNWALDKTEQRGGRGPVDCSPFEVTDEAGGGREKHAVPHYLLGQYEAAKEFQTMYGIPQEAAFGGSETLYPEYMSKFAQLRASYLNRNTTAAKPAAGKTAAAQTDFFGSWRLNRAKSTFDVSWRREGLDGRDGSAPEKRVMMLSRGTDGAITHVTDTQIVANDTGFHRVEYTAKFDGKDYPVMGGAIETYALKRVDATTVERVGKIKGQAVETATWKLSPDGRTMTVSTQGRIESEKAEYKNVQVFERTDQ